MANVTLTLLALAKNSGRVVCKYFVLFLFLLLLFLFLMYLLSVLLANVLCTCAVNLFVRLLSTLHSFLNVRIP